MAESNELVLEIDRQSIRGRACPRCAGKIIPSNRAIYQSTGDASEVFPLWQCERCGYEQLSATAIDGKKAGKEAPARKEIAARAASAAPPTPAVMRDVKGRVMPRDVQTILQQMGKQQQKNP